MIVTGGGYVSTKTGSNGSAQQQAASPVLARIELTRAEEALRPHQHRSAPIPLWLDARLLSGQAAFPLQRDYFSLYRAAVRAFIFF